MYEAEPLTGAAQRQSGVSHFWNSPIAASGFVATLAEPASDADLPAPGTHSAPAV